LNSKKSKKLAEHKESMLRAKARNEVLTEKTKETTSPPVAQLPLPTLFTQIWYRNIIIVYQSYK